METKMENYVTAIESKREITNRDGEIWEEIFVRALAAIIGGYPTIPKVTIDFPREMQGFCHPSHLHMYLPCLCLPTERMWVFNQKRNQEKYYLGLRVSNQKRNQEEYLLGLRVLLLKKDCSTISISETLWDMFQDLLAIFKGNLCLHQFCKLVCMMQYICLMLEQMPSEILPLLFLRAVIGTWWM